MAEKTNVADCLLQDKNNVMEEITPEDLSPLLKHKLSTMSCDNAKWHLKSKEEDARATLCKLIQSLYLGLTSQL